VSDEHPYARFYRRWMPHAAFVFARDGFRVGSGVRRLSLVNRLRDYLALRDRPAMFALHAAMNAHLFAAQAEWRSHDYGEGYFYQGLAALGVRGLRDTGARVAAMGLEGRLRGLRVIEIGCNTGFVTLAVAGAARHVVGLDLNPSLVAVATTAAGYLAADNVRFVASSWEAFDPPEPADAVLSFANHATYDGNTGLAVETYFDKCHAATRPGGLLLFESHAPAHEGRGLEDVIAVLGRRFQIRERRVLDGGTFLDRGRTFVVARRR
jgi:SAM-dependent methyltransferase